MPLRWRAISPRSLFLIKNHHHTRSLTSLTMPITSRNRARNPSEEIVDDSEPERVELRRQQRKSSPSVSHTSTKRVTSPFHQPSLYTHIHDVIEISDSDSEPSCSYSNVISNDLYFRNVSPSDILESSNRIQICEAEELTSTISGQPSSSLLDGQDSTIPSTSNIPFIDSKRFAYVSTTTVKKPSATLPPKGKDTVAPPQRRKNASFDLPNIDLSKVLRCVCCELSWTVRKSGPQKLSHIRSCAKKHSFTEETILILLQKEVSGYVKSSKQAGSIKATETAATEAGPSAKTYLEELVNVPSKKKSKHKEAKTRLANISVTRDSILARAQGILNNPATSGFENRTNDSIMNDFSQRPLVDASHDDMPPTTQPFGHSSLAHLPGLASKTSLFNVNTSPVRADLHNGETSQRSIHIQQRSLGEPIGSLGTGLFPDDLRMAQRDVRSHMTFHKNDLPGISDHEFQLPKPSDTGPKATTRSRSPSRQTSLTRRNPKLTPNKGSKDIGPSSPRLSLDDALARLTLKSTPKKAKRTAKPRTPKTTVKPKKAVFGAEWEAHMKMHILRDPELHRQILRYQPIHFDVFLEFAKLYAPVSNKLKLQLQLFLDQQAILFFGTHTWNR